MTGRGSDKTKVWPARRAKRLGVSPSLCLLVFLPLLTGCDLPGRPDPADRPVPADQVLDFGVLYRQNCAGCHGSDGKLGPAPPLNDPLFRAIIPQEELEGIITKGRKNTLMPAFAKDNGGTLTAAQIQVLVKEIKGVALSPKWGPPGNPPKDVPSYRELFAVGGLSAPTRTGTKEKGAVVFARACAMCHGSKGQGIGQGNETVHAINDRVFLALISDQTLRRYVITGRPDLGMPNYAEGRPGSAHFVPLTDRDVSDLVALLTSWRGEK
jgi:cytochrome c oxidase cbb3-type subunit 3